jgi:SAM-dependent methyltransferase
MGERDAGARFLAQGGRLMNPVSPIPLETMALYVSELKAGALHWRSLLSDPRFGALHRRQRWFTDRQKGMFFRLLSPPHRDAFLEVQAGSGIVSSCLSEDFKRGYAWERRPVCADFIELRFKSDSIDNLEVLRAAGSAIALPGESLDLVAINEPITMEHATVAGVDAEEFALAILREALRCLRRTGRLIMAVDNAWHYLKLSELISSRFSRASTLEMRPRSGRGYLGLVNRVGFRKARLFTVKPSRHMPIDIYSHHRVSLDQLYWKYGSQSRVSRTTKWLSDTTGVPYLAAHFQPSFYLVCEK